MWRPGKNKDDALFVERVKTICWYAFWFLLAAFVLFFLFYRFSSVRATLSTINKALRGVFYGLIIAYLLNPVDNWFQNLFRRMFVHARHADKLAKGLGITCALLVGIGLVVLFFALIIPNLFQSISTLISNLPTYEENIQTLIQGLKHSSSETKTRLAQLIDQASQALNDWLSNNLSSKLSDVVTTVTSGLVNVVSFFFNLIVGFIISAYVLRDKKKVVGQSKKLCVALFSPLRADSIMETFRQGHRIFGGFIYGKILDSLIIGLICFIGTAIMQIPYYLLVSVIVCITNIIPFFGPFIGAVPSLLLILMVDPMKALYFLIFIIVLQQVDGNIIGPKILGNNLGINEFWVTFSLLLFGSIFGLFGMVIGAPLFALCYYFVARAVSRTLSRKNLPTSSADYVSIQRVADLDKASPPDQNGADKAEDSAPNGETGPEHTDSEKKENGNHKEESS